MAYTIADRDTLKSALARGVLRVRMNGEEVEYQSAANMRRTLNDIEAELAGTASSAGSISVSYPTTSRGL